MKKSLLFVSLSLLLANNNTFSMSPHRLTPTRPATVQPIIKDLQREGAIDLKKDEITIYLATAVCKRLGQQRLRDSFDQTISHQDREERKKQAIATIIAREKEQLLVEAATLQAELREADTRRRAGAQQDDAAADWQAERDDAAADWRNERDAAAADWQTERDAFDD